MADVMKKGRAVRDIVPMYEPSLDETVLKLAVEAEAIRSSTQHAGLVITPHHIGTAAIFSSGGQTFGPDYLTDDILQAADDTWPDALLLLEPGKVVLKRYQSDGGFRGRNTLELYDFGDGCATDFHQCALSSPRREIDSNRVTVLSTSVYTSFG